MQTLLWKKLAVNCAINSLTALRGCKNSGLQRGPDDDGYDCGDGGVHLYNDDQRVMDDVIREVSAVTLKKMRIALV